MKEKLKHLDGVVNCRVDLNFESYSHSIREYSLTFAIANDKDKTKKLMVYALGLAGETGEVSELLKRFFRGDVKDENDQKEKALILRLKKELGDVLAYLVLLGSCFNIEFTDIAKTNLEKLYERYQHGNQLGEGDER